MILLVIIVLLMIGINAVPLFMKNDYLPQMSKHLIIVIDMEDYIVKLF